MLVYGNCTWILTSGGSFQLKYLRPLPNITNTTLKCTEAPFDQDNTRKFMNAKVLVLRKGCQIHFLALLLVKCPL